jgi:predicted metal-dependent hydrolase
MAVKKVDVPNLGSVHLYKRRGVRSMRLTVTSTGVVRVSLPHWIPYASGVAFAIQKQAWIRSQQVKPSLVKHNARVGKAHHISFVSDPARLSIATRITKEGEIRIHHPATLHHESDEVQKAAERAGIRALKNQAQILLPQRLDILATQNGFTYRSVHIKQLKSRWGSCSDQGHIALSCFLMQLPWHLIDYVLLHELVHTRVMAHGPVFWGELDQYVSNLKNIRKEIKDHRPILVAE